MPGFDAMTVAIFKLCGGRETTFFKAPLPPETVDESTMFEASAAFSAPADPLAEGKSITGLSLVPPLAFTGGLAVEFPATFEVGLQTLVFFGQGFCTPTTRAAGGRAQFVIGGQIYLHDCGHLQYNLPIGYQDFKLTFK